MFRSLPPYRPIPACFVAYVGKMWAIILVRSVRLRGAPGFVGEGSHARATLEI